MNQEGKKKSRESLLRRIAATLYSLLLVFSLAPTQSLAEARDEVIDLMDDAVVIGAQSDDDTILTSDADEDILLGTDEDVVAAVQDEQSVNFYMEEPVLDADYPNEVKWVARFTVPKEGLPVTTFKLDYPFVEIDGTYLYDTLSSDDAVDVTQDWPTKNYQEVTKPDDAPAQQELTPEEEQANAAEEAWNERNEVPEPVKDSYVIDRTDTGFTLTFNNGLRAETNPRTVTITFWTNINQVWYSTPGVQTEHIAESLLTIASGDNAGEFSMSGSIIVNPTTCKSHDDKDGGKYTQLNNGKHRWTCDKCGYYEDLDHEFEELSGNYICEKCGAVGVTVTFMPRPNSEGEDTSAQGTMPQLIKTKDEMYALPENAFSAPVAGQRFSKWEVQVGNEAKTGMYPGEVVKLEYNTVITAKWQDSVEYKTADGGSESVFIYELVDSQTKDLSPGWYVVQGDVDLSDRFISVEAGVTNLILCAGSTLTTARIDVKNQGELNIYGQTEGAGEICAPLDYGIKNYNKVRIYGGKITGSPNAAVFNSGELTLGDCEIVNNAVGIENPKALTSKLNIIGSPKVSDNGHKETISNIETNQNYNVMLPEGMNINVIGKLNNDARIGIRTHNTVTRAFTNDYGKYDNPGDPSKIFKSDYTNLAIKPNKNDSGEAETEKAILYMSYDAETQTYKEKYQKEFTTITSSTGNPVIKDGWYVVEENTTIDGRLQIEGSGVTNIILCDNATLNCKKGVRTNNTNGIINIYGQSNNTGILQATATDSHNAGIGANEASITELNIYGGKIIAKGADHGAGIGGGGGGGAQVAGVVRIYGGEVEATSGNAGAAIGGGTDGQCPEIFIYGGKVTATGLGRGTGIGSGCNAENAPIHITGGTVVAKGGDYGGAAIGTGATIDGGKVGNQSGIIEIGGDAVVHATATKYGSGIGTGDDQRSGGTAAKAGEIVIYGHATVVAQGADSGAGIGGGDDSGYGGKITIKDAAKVTARGVSGGAGIGGGAKNSVGNGKGCDIIIQTTNVLDESGKQVLDDNGNPEVLCPVVEAYSKAGSAIGAASNGTEEGGKDFDPILMVWYGDDEQSLLRTCYANEREDICKNNYVKIERCNHQGSFDTSALRYSATTLNHRVTCLLCKSIVGNEESHTIEDGICTKCGFGQEIISYIDAEGKQYSKNITDVVYLSDVNDNVMKSEGTEEQWYATNSNRTFNERVTIEGKVNLILTDGIEVKFNKGIELTDGNELTIWTQRGESGILRAEIAQGVVDGYAGIGGSIDSANSNGSFGKLTINGGNIYAKASNTAAGIGTGPAFLGGEIGEIRINRGNVVANGGAYGGAGIGGASGSSLANVDIYGGTVTATSGPFTDNKGTMQTGAGIGGGYGAGAGTISIHGGNVKATGLNNAAGIGTGSNCNGSGQKGLVTITDGVLEAKSTEDAAGIGGGWDSIGCDVNISGGKVTAVGHDMGAGIGGGRHYTGGTITISGGIVNASCLPYAGSGQSAAIGSGTNSSQTNPITITGGQVYAHTEGSNSGAGIGAGTYGSLTANVTISGKDTLVDARTDSASKSAAIGGGTSGSFRGIFAVSDDAVVIADAGNAGDAVGSADGASASNITTRLYKTAKVVKSRDNESDCATTSERAAAFKEHYVKIMPCDHKEKIWVSTDDEQHWRQCKYCEAAKTEVGVGNVVPHDFVLSADHKCTCGRQGRLIEFDPGYATGTMPRVYRAVDTNYELPSPKFVAPEGAKFAGWRINGLKEQEGAIRYNTETIAITSTDLTPIKLTAQWDDSRGVPYTNADGETAYASDYMRMSRVSDYSGVSLGETSSWYYVDTTSQTFNNRVDIKGEVNIILGDYSTIEFKAGIHLNTVLRSKLNIWVQKEANGVLKASTEASDDLAAIGGNYHETNGEINIYGGVITATAANNAAAIGGGNAGGGGTINIYDGTVTAKHSSNTKWGAGIGAGGAEETGGSGGNITIYGGKVTAAGGRESAGIGGASWYSNGGTTKILGGEVTATGGEYGPGIGSGGRFGHQYDITIMDAKVTAKAGSNAAGIGSGLNSNGAQGKILIGGTANVTAVGKTRGAGIGGGENSNCGQIVITDQATISAENGYSYDYDANGCPAIGSGYGVSKSNDPITFYNSATVYTYTLEPKMGSDGKQQTDKDGKPVYYAVPNHALANERLTWMGEKGNIQLSPCSHKDSETAYQAQYVPTEDGKHHVVDCKYCTVSLDEPLDHTFNSKGICAKCKASAIRVTFDPNGGSGSMGAKNVIEGGKIGLPKCTFTEPEGKRFAGWTVGTNEYTDPSELKQYEDEIVVTESVVVYAQWRDQPTLKVWSATMDLATQGVSHISIQPGVQEWYGEGTNVTLSASMLTEYDFIGWYNVTELKEDGTVKSIDTAKKVSSDPNYTFAIQEDTMLLAAFDPKELVEISVDVANGAQYYINDSKTAQTGHTVWQEAVGAEFTLTAVDGTKVKDWTNESGKRISTDATISVVVTRKTKIVLTYTNVELTGNKSYVCFRTDYNQVLTSREYGSTDDKIYFPVPPTKPGFSFDGWVFDEPDKKTKEFAGLGDDKDTGSLILAKVGTVQEINLIPTYTYIGHNGTLYFNTVVHYVNVNKKRLTNDNTSIKTVKKGYCVGTSFTAPDIAPGQDENTAEDKKLVFDHWEAKDGTILGYSQKLSVVPVADRVIYGVYVLKNSTYVSAPSPIIVQQEPIPIEVNGKYKVAGICTYSIPNGWTLVDYGFIKSFDHPDIRDATIVLDGYKIEDPYTVEPTKVNQQNASVVYNVSVGTDVNKKVTLRGFAHIKNNTTNQMEIVYSDIITRSYNDIANS